MGGSLAYAFGKAAEIIVQNPVATGMTALLINYGLYKVGFYDPRAEYDEGEKVWHEPVIVHHERETATDNEQHLIGQWVADQSTAEYPMRWRAEGSYPYLWRWTNVNGTFIWQWTGTYEQAQGQPWPAYSGTYEGQMAPVVNPILFWQWQGTSAEAQGQPAPPNAPTSIGQWAPVVNPLYGWRWESPQYGIPDPINGGVDVWCPYHKDQGLLLLTVRPTYYENASAIPAKVFCHEQAGHVYVVREAWDETVKEGYWETLPGRAHYFNYDFEPFSLSTSGIEFFKVTKGDEVSKVEGGSRIAMLYSLAILAGTVAWARYEKSSFAGGGAADTASLLAIAKTVAAK